MRPLILFSILLFLFTATGYSDVIDLIKNPPNPGTPEKLAYDYVKALHAGNKEAIKALSSPDKIEHHQKLLNSIMPKIQAWDLEKKFAFKVSKKNSETELTVKVGSVLKESGKSKLRTLNIIKSDGKWLLK